MTAAGFVGWGAMALAGICLSALFSGLETGLYTINRVRIVVRANRGERAARRLQHEIRKANRLLSTLLLGNNVANYLGTFGVAAILNGMGLTTGLAIVINAGLLIPLLFIFGETLPKDLFRTHTDRWTYALSGLLTLCRWIFTWTGLLAVVQLTGRLAGRLIGAGPEAAATARQRMSRLIKEGVGTGVLSESQATLADRALAMRERTVATEMIPWASVLALPVAADARQREALMRDRHFTRMPVVDAAGRVVGILSSIDALLEPDQPTAGLMSKIMTIPATVPLREALRTMRLDRQAMAVAVDPRTGQPEGLVTLKDLVEPITGELAAW
ncbi:MAG: CNNM domain-containing protein [Planctomycetota bacterium]|jgi:CBS domain containing-hemolysin-like protein